MGLRFRKSIKICKGLSVNIGTKGVSLSVGTKGVRGTVHSSGRVTGSVGLPGTGLSYVKSTNLKKLTKKVTSAKDNRKKEESLQDDANAVAEFEEQLNAVRNLHQVSDPVVDWKKIASGRKTEYNALLEEGLKGLKGGEAGHMQWQSAKEVAEAVLDGDIYAYFFVVGALKPFDDILEYGGEFEAGTDLADVMEVEFHVKSSDVIPEEMLSLTSTGKLSVKPIGKTMYFDIEQDYVCSCILRVARDMFALLPVDKVVIHAVETVLNTASGNEEEQTIVSTCITRENLQQMNMERIDPSDAVSALDTHMNFKKLSGFMPVERIDF